MKIGIAQSSPGRGRTRRCTRAGGSVGFEVNAKRARRVNLVVRRQELHTTGKEPCDVKTPIDLNRCPGDCSHRLSGSPVPRTHRESV